jgi:signal transduction histidine kinase
MGLIGGAATVWPRTVQAAPLPEGATNDPAWNEADFPLIIANLPATGQQRRMAVGVAVLLIVAAAIIAPFASIHLGRVDAFIPVLQTTLSLADFITATLLFAQYSIQPQRALLALASGYMFSGSFAFLQTLAFPGGYAAAGLIGDGPNSPAWIYVLWHTTFPAAILVYALSKDAPGAPRSGRSVAAAIAITLACALAAIAGLTWIVTTKAEYLPHFYTDIRFQTPLGNQANVALLIWGLTAFAVLLSRGRTILDLWLMLTLLAYSPNFLVAIIGISVRFTVGWYAARCFVLVGSCMLLGVLLTETMLLYSRLASAITLQRRERTNRLLSVDAVTGAIAHELRTPLGAIALNAGTALSQLRSSPRDLEDLEDILGDIEADSHRAAAMISSIREMTTRTTKRSVLTSAEEVAWLALRLLKHDLQINKVFVTTDFQGSLPDVRIDGLELQQVLLNLVRNAIDAMNLSPPEARRLQLKTSFDGRSTV